MKKIILFLVLLICVVSINAQTTWLNNDTIIGYKTTIKNYSGAVQNLTSFTIDNDSSTFVKFNSCYNTNNTVCDEVSYYYDLKQNRTINSFKIYCPTNGIRYFELYCSDNSDDDWIFVLKHNFNILNYSENSIDCPSFIYSNFQQQTARYWKLVVLCDGDGGFKIYEIGFGAYSTKEMSAAKGSAFVKNNILNVKNVNGLVSIFSVNGSLVSKAIVNGNGSIDINYFNSGIYFIKGNNISEKFIK